MIRALEVVDFDALVQTHRRWWKDYYPASFLSVPFAEIESFYWICHNLWVQYRCTMDETFLKEKLYPLLRRAVNAYLHQIEKDEQGVYHIPYGHSPESYSGTDTNYDLSSLRWGCQTLLRITEQLGVKDEKAALWADILENLAKYPRDENGYMNAPGVPAPAGHRHWSHLISRRVKLSCFMPERSNRSSRSLQLQ